MEITLALTKEQYENLLKVVYLGNWMINAIRSGAPGDEQIEKYNEIAQYIYSFAKDAQLEKYIEFDEKYGEFFPTEEFEMETDIEQYRQDYDEETFWEDLIDKLAWRDFENEYGLETVKQMTPEERIEKEYPFEEKYRTEFGEYGIDRLHIQSL